MNVRLLAVLLCVLAALLWGSAQADDPPSPACVPTPTIEPETGYGRHLTPSWYPTTTPLPYAVWLPAVHGPECAPLNPGGPLAPTLRNARR